MPRITEKAVKAEFEKLKRSRRTNPGSGYGDGCHYTDPDTGKHCVAGQVLLNLGCRLPDLESRDNSDVIPAAGSSAWKRMFGVTRISDGAAYLLREAQVLADEGHDWGKSVKTALASLER